MQTALEQRGRCGGSGPCRFAGFTLSHMPQPISQLRLHLTLDMRPAAQTSAWGWEQRGEWQTTGWWERAGVMDCEVEDLERQREGPSAFSLSVSRSLSLSGCDSDTLMGREHSGQEWYISKTKPIHHLNKLTLVGGEKRAAELEHLSHDEESDEETGCGVNPSVEARNQDLFRGIMRRNY